MASEEQSTPEQERVRLRDMVAALVTPAERALLGDALWSLVMVIGAQRIPHSELYRPTGEPCADPDLERFVEATILRIRAAAFELRERDPAWPPPPPPAEGETWTGPQRWRERIIGRADAP